MTTATDFLGSTGTSPPPAASLYDLWAVTAAGSRKLTPGDVTPELAALAVEYVQVSALVEPSDFVAEMARRVEQRGELTAAQAKGVLNWLLAQIRNRRSQMGPSRGQFAALSPDGRDDRGCYCCIVCCGALAGESIARGAHDWCWDALCGDWSANASGDKPFCVTGHTLDEVRDHVGSVERRGVTA